MSEHIVLQRTDGTEVYLYLTPEGDVRSMEIFFPSPPKPGDLITPTNVKKSNNADRANAIKAALLSRKDL